MAQVTVTRANGDTEKIVLADSKEAGREYMSFKCSDGVTRYALLGKQNDENASHLWVQKNGGEKKYVIKTPVINEEVPTGVLWGKSNIKTIDKVEQPRQTEVTIPNGVRVIAVNMILKPSGSILTKYVGVTPGKTYKMTAFNTYHEEIFLDPEVGNIKVYQWQSIVSSNLDKEKYYRKEEFYGQYVPNDFLLQSVGMRYSPEINKHTIDIEDY